MSLTSKIAYTKTTDVAITSSENQIFKKKRRNQNNTIPSTSNVTFYETQIITIINYCHIIRLSNIVTDPMQFHNMVTGIQNLS